MILKVFYKKNSKNKRKILILDNSFKNMFLIWLESIFTVKYKKNANIFNIKEKIALKSLFNILMINKILLIKKYNNQKKFQIWIWQMNKKNHIKNKINAIFVRNYLLIKILKLETIIIQMVIIEEQHIKRVIYNLIYTILKFQS